MKTHIRSHIKGWALGISATLLVLLAVVSQIYGAHLNERPVSNNVNQIYQDYLWAESGHRGVDFPNEIGTSVFALADGYIVDMRENIDNNLKIGEWGNFVLLRHTRRHYDRESNQTVCVYSMYLHLKYNSVVPTIGSAIIKGQQIAQVDNTGSYSDGHHLHLQIVLNPDCNAKLEGAPFIDSENRSRNPELWIKPYAYGTTQTATAIGKVTDIYGNPVSGSSHRTVFQSRVARQS